MDEKTAQEFFIKAVYERIKALEAELAKTKEGLSIAVEAMVNRWIPVSEKLPNEGERVLVWSKRIIWLRQITNEEGEIWEVTMAYRADGRWEADHRCRVEITHWTPLPVPPGAK